MSEKIKDFLRRYFIVDEIDGDDNIFELGYVNSLFIMQLILFLEAKMNIAIEPEDIDIIEFSSVNNIIQFIERKTAL